jgi:nucleoside-triphosphatase THEP1
MITIFSGPIHSGKTSRLLQWAGRQPDVAGIATPVREGLKVLYDLAEKKYHPLQIDAASHSTVVCITIGKYLFSQAAFLTGRQILEQAAQQNQGWLIIDEIGPLELDGQGFEPAAGRIIRQYVARKRSSNLLLVIRDTILHRVLDYYGIAIYSFFNY